MLTDVVISTRDNASSKAFSLQYVVKSLLRYARRELNIIVADNGSEDDTVSRLRSTFGTQIDVIDTGGHLGNISASRNLAAQRGGSELILFIDDDTIPRSPTAIDTSLQVASQVDFACGARRLWAPQTWPVLVRPDDPVHKFISTLENTSVEPLGVDRLSGKRVLDNRSYIANFGVVRRDVFSQVGGFDESYIGFGYQDADLMWRLCAGNFEYDLFSKYDIDVFHLTHKVDKGGSYRENHDRYFNKLREDGRMFHTNHFFEIYENDGYSLFSDISS